MAYSVLLIVDVFKQSIWHKFAKNIYIKAIKKISILQDLQCVLWKNVHTVSVFQRKLKLKSAYLSMKIIAISMLAEANRCDFKN